VLRLIRRRRLPTAVKLEWIIDVHGFLKKSET